MSDPQPIVLGAESVRAEIHEAPAAHDLTPAQARRMIARSDEEINALVRELAGDAFWDAYDELRRRVIARLADERMVCVALLDGDDYEAAVDAANEHGGSTEAVVAYLAQWDYGAETDSDAEMQDHTQLADLERWQHQLHEVDHQGIHYHLVLDHGLRFYSLYRRPLD